MEQYIEYFGYLASFIILVSLMMHSIIKLRWINFVGAVLFGIFGIMIKSMPTAFLNFTIAIINIYYLWQTYRKKEEIVLVEAEKDSKYLQHIYEKNKDEIKYFFPDFNPYGEIKTYYMLRDNAIAGILVFSDKRNNLMNIELDYVFKKYRDYKLGEYFFVKKTNILKKMGFEMIYAKAANEKHRNYLIKLGFKEYGENEFIKNF